MKGRRFFTLTQIDKILGIPSAYSFLIFCQLLHLHSKGSQHLFCIFSGLSKDVFIMFTIHSKGNQHKFCIISTLSKDVHIYI